MAGISDFINQYILGPAFAPTDPNFVGPPMPPQVLRQQFGITSPNSAGPAVAVAPAAAAKQGEFLRPVLENIIRGGQAVSDNWSQIPGNIARGAERVGAPIKAGIEKIVPPTSPAGEFLYQAPAHAGVADAAVSAVKTAFTPKSEGTSSPTAGATGRLSWVPSSGTVAPGVPSAAGGAQPGQGSAGDPIGNYLNKMFNKESGNRDVPNAAGASSAAGWAQFTDGTWINTVRKHIPETQALSDKDILAMRKDEKFHKEMARNFTMDNAKALQQNGLPVTDASLYGMHFFGEGDGPKVLKASDTEQLEKVISPASMAANPHLKGMSVGQAKVWLEKQMGGNPAPALPNLQTPQLGAVPTLQAPQGVDLSGMMDIVKQMKPTERAELGTGDRLANILGGMAAGAASGKGGGISDFLLRAGAGAAQGGEKTRQINDRRAEQNRDDQYRYLGTLADATGRVAQQTAQNANNVIETNNKNAMNAYERTVQQSKLDTGTKNTLEELKYKIDFNQYEAGKPQVTVSGGNIISITRDQNGKPTIQTQSLKDTDDNIYKIMDTLEKAGLKKGTPEYDKLRYVSLGKAFDGNPLLGEVAYRRELIKDMVEGGTFGLRVKSPTIVKQVMDQAAKGVDKTLQATNGVEYQKQVNQRIAELFLEQAQDQKLPDTWIKEMADSGHYGAALFIARAQAAQGAQ